MKQNLHLKTTKRQWVLVAIELCALILFPLFLLQIAKSDITLIVGLIIAFVTAIICCFFVLKENKKLRAAEQNRLKKKQERADKISSFMKDVENLSFEQMNEQQFTFFVVDALYISSMVGSLTFFYRDMVEFDLKEIVSKINRLPISKELHYFLEGIVLAQKDTISVNRFEFELSELINFVIEDNWTMDPTMSDTSYVYSSDQHTRFHIVSNKKNTAFYVEKETFEHWNVSWCKEIDSKRFSSQEKANEYLQKSLQKCEKELVPDYFKIREYTQKERHFDEVFYAYRKNKLEEKWMKFMSYYLSVVSDGHEAFLENFKFEDYRPILDELLPQELKQVLFFIDEYDKSYSHQIAVCDQYVREHRDFFLDIIDQIQVKK